MDEIRIVLGSLRFKTSTNTDLSIPTPLVQNSKNLQEFVVERIVRHEKRPSPLAHVKREQLFLFVKWEGYDEAANSWEPIAGLYHLPLVRDYLRAHKLASYIPASVRDDDEKNLRPRRRRSN